MVVRLLVGEMVTGRVLATMSPSSLTYSIALNTDGTIEATLSLRSEDYRTLIPNGEGGWVPSAETRPDLAAVLTPWRSFLAVVEGNRVIEAGPILPHSYAMAAGELRIRAGGLWSMWDERRVVRDPLPGERVQDIVLAYSDLSLGTIAKRIVQVSLTREGGALPVVLPADVSGLHEREYAGWELRNLREELTRLIEVEGGPDIEFLPRLTDSGTRVEWVMRHGSQSSPLLSQTSLGGAPWVIPAGQARGEGADVIVDRDPSGQVTCQWVTGDGQDTALLIARQVASAQHAAGYPLLESVIARSNVRRMSTLTNHAVAALRGNLRPWATWTVPVQCTESTWQMRPGDWCLVRVGPGDPYIAEGDHKGRLVSMSGALGSEFVSLKFAPSMESR